MVVELPHCGGQEVADCEMSVETVYPKSQKHYKVRDAEIAAADNSPLLAQPSCFLSGQQLPIAKR